MQYNIRGGDMEVINQSKIITLDTTLYRKDTIPSGDIHLGTHLYENRDIISFTSNLDELVEEGINGYKIICIEKGERVEAIFMDDLYFLVLKDRHLEVISLRGNFVTCIMQSKGV